MEKNLTGKDPNLMSPLQLAYIGDAVFELMVRLHLVTVHDMKVGDLHKEAVIFVKAKSQAMMVKQLEEDFTEEEMSIIKRGRNAKSVTVPKNAKMIDYKYATGFEALLGYLYISGRMDRIDAIFEKIKKMDLR
ncbi:MAG: Mini-ribonuclease 3 [Tissierellales bacterium]|nr:Mini-ribonuclease 3 [Tissierellales bacterium]MBN2827869.1 Mini-ribonuclease 3 [Tissierellales bacterium]